MQEGLLPVKKKKSTLFTRTHKPLEVTEWLFSTIYQWKKTSIEINSTFAQEKKLPPIDEDDDDDFASYT